MEEYLNDSSKLKLADVCDSLKRAALSRGVSDHYRMLLIGEVLLTIMFVCIYLLEPHSDALNRNDIWIVGAIVLAYGLSFCIAALNGWSNTYQHFMLVATLTVIAISLLNGHALIKTTDSLLVTGYLPWVVPYVGLVAFYINVVLVRSDALRLITFLSLLGFGSIVVGVSVSPQASALSPVSYFWLFTTLCLLPFHVTFLSQAMQAIHGQSLRENLQTNFNLQHQVDQHGGNAEEAVSNAGSSDGAPGRGAYSNKPLIRITNLVGAGAMLAGIITAPFTPLLDQLDATLLLFHLGVYVVAQICLELSSDPVNALRFVAIFPWANMLFLGAMLTNALLRPESHMATADSTPLVLAYIPLIITSNFVYLKKAQAQKISLIFMLVMSLIVVFSLFYSPNISAGGVWSLICCSVLAAHVFVLNKLHFLVQNEVHNEVRLEQNRLIVEARILQQERITDKVSGLLNDIGVRELLAKDCKKNPNVVIGMFSGIVKNQDSASDSAGALTGHSLLQAFQQSLGSTTKVGTFSGDSIVFWNSDLSDEASIKNSYDQASSELFPEQKRDLAVMKASSISIPEGMCHGFILTHELKTQLLLQAVGAVPNQSAHR